MHTRHPSARTQATAFGYNQWPTLPPSTAMRSTSFAPLASPNPIQKLRPVNLLTPSRSFTIYPFLSLPRWSYWEVRCSDLPVWTGAPAASKFALRLHRVPGSHGLALNLLRPACVRPGHALPAHEVRLRPSPCESAVARSRPAPHHIRRRNNPCGQSDGIATLFIAKIKMKMPNNAPGLFRAKAEGNEVAGLRGCGRCTSRDRRAASEKGDTTIRHSVAAFLNFIRSSSPMPCAEAASRCERRVSLHLDPLELTRRVVTLLECAFSHWHRL